jgi:hypothetical protein
MILRPSKSKTILLAFGSLLFVVAGIWILEDDNWGHWFVIAFFGVCFLVAVVQLFPGSSELKLTKEGFTITSLFKSHFTPWKDVQYFKEGYVGRTKMVMFDYVDDHNKFPLGKSISKYLSKSHSALPDTYGLKTSNLVKIMNDWKNKKYGA